MARQKGEKDGVVFSHAGDIYAANDYPRLAILYWQMAILLEP